MLPVDSDMFDTSHEYTLGNAVVTRPRRLEASTVNKMMLSFILPDLIVFGEALCEDLGEASRVIGDSWLSVFFHCCTPAARQ